MVLRGSFQNRMMERAPNPEPEIGMGATLPMYTDRHAYTVLSIRKNKAGQVVALDARQDKAIRTDSNGMSDCQNYAFESDARFPVETFTRRKNGAWIRKGESINGQRLVLGFRSAYYDYGF